MKRIAPLALIGAGLLALPGPALANHGSTCQYAGAGLVNQTVGDTKVVVYTNQGTTPYSLAGACLYDASGFHGFHGGTAEVGAGGPTEAGVVPGVYAVQDGDDSNTDASGLSYGYVGASNTETGDPNVNDECDGAPVPGDQTDDGSGTNDGGCLSLRASGTVLASLPVPLLACGHNSGPNWHNASRDGCTPPEPSWRRGGESGSRATVGLL